MRCRPLRWLWGLIPLAILGVLIHYGERPRIEKDLSARTGQALLDAGYSWAGGTFEGRDGLVKGVAGGDGERDQAVAVAQQVWGVRIINDGTGLIKLIKPYVWAASREGGVIRLAGYVPSEPTRRRIIDLAKRSFHNARVEDGMRLGRGAQELAHWQGGTEFALAMLSGLQRGEVRLDDLGLTVIGDAETIDSYRAIKKALATALPEQVTLLRENVRPPAVSPYVWSARNENKKLLLTGYVPAESARDTLLDAAGVRFPGIAVADQMEVASGAPNDWTLATAFALGQLAKLESGVATFTGTQGNLSGMAGDQATAEKTASAYRAGMPTGYTVSDNILYRQPSVQPVSPYVWSACLAAATLTLEGFIPSEDAREALLSYTSQRFPGTTVVDRTKVAAGVPTPQASWLGSLRTGLRALAMTGNGCAKQTDKMLKVTGATEVAGLTGRIDDLLRKSLPTGFKGAEEIVYTPALAPEPVTPEPVVPPAPYRTTFRYNGLDLLIEGVVPNEDARKKVLAQARKALPDRNFLDRTTIRNDAPGRWDDAIATGLTHLAQLESGEYSLNDTKALLSGTTDNEGVLARAKQAMRSGLPKGYQGSEQIAYVPPPEPDPTINAKKVDPKDFDIGELLASKNPLSAPECQVALDSVIERNGKAFFAINSHILDNRATVTLERLADVAQRCPQARIAIAGHTDSDGARTYNQRLSERRANAVVEFLTTRGVTAERLSAVGHGEMRPVRRNTTAANKARNRRIEFEVDLNLN